MFIQRLIKVVASQKFSFQIEVSGDDIVFIVLPSGEAPKCEGVVAQAHAALAVPLRVIVTNDGEVDEAIMSQIESYMGQRQSLISNLDVINKAVAGATRAVKQESKDKDSASNDSNKDSAVESTTEKTAEPTKSRSLEL